jgi:mRNA-degrading endonuclease toxin of MazEF toxin-antitoxin module
MNAKQRKEYWMKTERLRAGLDKKYFEQVQKSVWDTFKRFARDIEVIGIDAARSRLGLDLWDKEMLKIFEAMYKESVLLFGNSVYRALRIEAQKAETFGFNREWTDAVLEFLLKQGFVLVADITSTTKKKLNDIVTKGIEEGLGVDEIVKLILSDDNLAYSAMRARRIVRTEVMRSSNIGAMKGAEAHGFYVDKIWISARDKRTRRIPEDEFDHVKMDGQTQHFEDPFTSTGKKGEPVVAMQPGDITAPAGFTINCRCTVGFEGRRDANGRLLRKPKLGAPTIGGINQQTIPTPTIQAPKPIPQPIQVYQPKKTTKEAEDWAKNNISIKIPSYDGFSIDVANTINETIFEIEKQVLTKSTATLKSGVQGSAYAQFDWGRNELLFRKRYVKVEERMNRDNEGWAKKYGQGRKYHATSDLKGLIAHEYGHAWDYATNRAMFNDLNTLPLDIQNKVYGISGYASYDRFLYIKKGAELIAEIFSARFSNTKEWQNLPVEAKNIINKYFK